MSLQWKFMKHTPGFVWKMYEGIVFLCYQQADGLLARGIWESIINARVS